MKAISEGEKNISAIKWSSIGFGVSQLTLWADNFGGPVSVLWYTQSARTIRIIHTFTVEFFRRRGYCRSVYDRLIELYPQTTHLVTDAGTDAGGKAFLDAYGFKPQEPWGYVYEIPKGDREGM